MSYRPVLLACALLLGCDSGPSVGLGRFHVVATRGANTCGAQALALQATVEFDVELKVGEGTIRWTPSGADSATGSWSASLRAFRVMQESDIVAWAADRRTGRAGCTIRRADVVEGSVTFDDADASVASDASAQGDGGAAPVARSFTATETIVYGATPGSDCAAAVGAGDGQFNAMPCNVTYTLTARRTGDNSATPAITF